MATAAERRTSMVRTAARAGQEIRPTMATVAPRVHREEVLSSADVEARPWRPVEGEGAHGRVLWEDLMSGSYSAVLQLAAGTSVAPHRHPAAAHHLYVVSGTCELSVSERVLGAGAYVFIPASAIHGIQAGPEGCTLFLVEIAQAS